MPNKSGNMNLAMVREEEEEDLIVSPSNTRKTAQSFMEDASRPSMTNVDGEE